MAGRAQEQIASEGPVPFLFGGRLCLDFINTVNSRARPATRDYLPDWPALLAWCRQTSALDRRMCDRIEELGLQDAAAAGDAHAMAIGLREAIYRIFYSLIAGQPAAEKELHFLDRVARKARQSQILRPGRPNFRWEWNEARFGFEAPALAVALAASDLLVQGDLRRVKQCPPPDGCGWLFYDETKNGARRWCSMEHCGGTAKARRYAERHGAAGL